MTKKEWLSRARHIDKEIKALEEAKQGLYERATKSTATINPTGGTQGSSEPYKAEEYAICAAEIERAEKRLQAVKIEVLTAINGIDDPDSVLRTILIEYYVSCKNWEQIAIDIGYSYRQTTRKHGEALAKIKIPGL